MLEGLVMQVAASEPAYYDLLTLSQSGLSSALGSFCGASVVINGQVFNCQFEWESNGSPQTSLNLVQSDGSLQAISCPYTVSLPYTAGADSLSSVVARGSFAYCLHVIIRVYPSTWASPVPAAKAQLGIQPEVITNQLVLAIVDIDAGALSGFWLGEEIKSPMATTLLVSADGTGVIVAASPPGPTSEYTLFTFGSSGLSQTGGGTTAASLVPNFCGAGLIDWPGPSLPLRQISRNCLQVLDPGSGALSLQALQRQIFNVRKPPTFRAAWQSGLSYIANADGRLFTTAASSESASPVSGLIPTSVNPGLAYEGGFLGNIWATAYDGSLLLIDNRIGVGGIWRFSPGQTTAADQLLPGSYFSQIVTDPQGRWLAANNPIEGTITLVDLEQSEVTAFTAPAGASLLEGGV
jgi:hypothetical protein